jgi:uncharacterized membrane protein YbhN (UPF0104 family)
MVVGVTPALWDVLSGQHWVLPIASSLFAVAFVGSVLPPVFSVLPRITSKLAPSARRHVDRPIAWRTFFQCLAIGIVAWFFLGVSFWACVKAVAPTTVAVDTIPAMTATFALSFVAGFLSMIPGHLGVREVILLGGILPLVEGSDAIALSATVLSRLITVVVEILMASILYLTLRGRQRGPAPGRTRSQSPFSPQQNAETA